MSDEPRKFTVKTHCTNKIPLTDMSYMGDHARHVDPNTGCIIHPNVQKYIMKITKNFLYVEDGVQKGHYDTKGFIVGISPRSDGRGKPKYQERVRQSVIDTLENCTWDPGEWHNRRKFVYLCFFLRKENYQSTDLDNLAKVFLDPLTEYIGDDKDIDFMVLDKHEIPSIDEEYENHLEMTFVIVGDIRNRSILLNVPEKL